MEKVRHHSASVLIVPPQYNQAIVGVYDSTYPVEVFRGNFLFLGGNGNKDRSPRAIVERELNEELSDKASAQETVSQIIGSAHVDPRGMQKEEREYAPKALRDELKAAVVANMNGFGDYLISVKGESVKKPNDLVYLSSAFIATVDERLFEEARNQLSQGKQLVNEGLAKIATLRELEGMNGAWGYATIIRHALSVKTQEHPFIRTFFLSSKPKESFLEYKVNYEYERDPEK